MFVYPVYFVTFFLKNEKIKIDDNIESDDSEFSQVSM